MSDNGTSMVPTGVLARQGFNESSLVRSADVGQSALEATATAEVQARYTMALRNPRNEMDSRRRMLIECRRPGFAEVAIYRKPIGGGKHAEGMSIRFAEAALRAWGNVYLSKVIVGNDDESVTVRVTALDLEANIAESVDVRVEKTVERRYLKEGQTPLRQRINSNGELVFIIAAEEGELLTKRKAEVAKAKREVAMALIPGDIVDECKAQARATMRNKDAADPKAAIKKICDAFSEIGVSAANLEEYTGHSLDGTSPAELEDLRGVFVAMKDGESWPAVMQSRVGDPKDERNAAVRAKIQAGVSKAKRAKGQPPTVMTTAPPPDAEFEQHPEPGSDG